MPSRIRQTRVEITRAQTTHHASSTRLHRSRRAALFPRAVAIGLLAWLAVSLTASTASATGTAPVRINTTATTATGVDQTWSILTTSGVRTHICRQTIAALSFTSSGAITIPNGAVRFGTCTFSGASVTMTQNQAWSGEVKHLDNASGTPIAFSVQLTNLSIHYIGAGCQFDLTGSLLGSTSISAAHNVLVNMSSIAYPSPLTSNPLSLVVSNVTGFCAILSIANGNVASFGGRFAFSPVISLAAI